MITHGDVDAPHRFVTDCSALRLTVADAFNQFALSTGAHCILSADRPSPSIHMEEGPFLVDHRLR